MMPIEFPNTFGFMNLNGIELLPLIMQLAFFGVLLFTAVSLLISFLHLLWYGGNSTRSFLSIAVFVVVAGPLFMFAYKIMPSVLFKLNI